MATAAHAQTAELAVRLREQVPMEKLAKSVLDPASARYRQYYTAEEIRALAGVPDKEYSAVLSALKAQGLEIVSESKSHLLITVRGDWALVSRLSSGLSAFSSGALSRVASFSAKDAVHHFHPQYQIASKHVLDNPVGGVDPVQIKSAYEFDPIYKSGYSGKGQHIAIATYDGFHMDDIQSYYAQTNVTPVPAVDQVQFNGVPVVNDNSAGETELDAEFSGMIAPGAQIHVFASAQNSDLGELQMFTAILDDDRAKVVNYSWGDCEAHIGAAHKADMDKVFARAIAQGVNIMVASGDSGSAGCRETAALNADWPGAHPDIIAVGGTTMGNSNGKLAETAWNGSGGGVSVFYDLPSYQSTFNTPFTKRSFPDVAFNADPQTGQATFIHNGAATGEWVVVGGTSIAAPQWSGYLALIGEARQNLTLLGPLNSRIYAIPASKMPDLFHDVTSGSNGGYSAGPGWDAVTGWGSMRASPLFNYLRND